jgi:hypothetical protein
MVNEARNMAGPIKDDELNRAKNLLKSHLFMQNETRSLQLEELANNLLFAQVCHYHFQEV